VWANNLVASRKNISHASEEKDLVWGMHNFSHLGIKLGYCSCGLQHLTNVKIVKGR
jgi:hypothetical protein